MVVGSGAVKFAINQGFLMESNTDILSEMTMKAYEVRLMRLHQGHNNMRHSGVTYL